MPLKHVASATHRQAARCKTTAVKNMEQQYRPWQQQQEQQQQQQLAQVPHHQVPEVQTLGKLPWPWSGPNTASQGSGSKVASALLSANKALSGATLMVVHFSGKASSSSATSSGCIAILPSPSWDSACDSLSTSAGCRGARCSWWTVAKLYPGWYSRSVVKRHWQGPASIISTHGLCRAFGLNGLSRYFVHLKHAVRGLPLVVRDEKEMRGGPAFFGGELRAFACLSALRRHLSMLPHLLLCSNLLFVPLHRCRNSILWLILECHEQGQTSDDDR